MSVNVDVYYLNGLRVFYYRHTIMCLAKLLLIHLKLFLVCSNNAAINIDVLSCVYSCLILSDKLLGIGLMGWRE